MDIQKIIAGCKQNERNAQEALFKSYAGYIYTICRRYAANNEDAKENMQDCFLKMFTKIEQYDTEKGTFKNWFTRIAINYSLNKIKANAKVIPIVQLEPNAFKIPTEDSALEIQNERQEKLIRAIQQLPKGYRQVLNLYIFEQKSHKEIGVLLGIEASSSRSQLTRAKTILKQIIEADHKTKSYGIR